MASLAYGGCESPDSYYSGAVVAECGLIQVGGNSVALYGIAPRNCATFEDAIRTAIGDGEITVSASYCYLVGEGPDARFAGSCEAPGDQYVYNGSFCAPSIDTPSWAVPGAIGDEMIPIRNAEGVITANVAIDAGSRKTEILQTRLIREGVAVVTCVPTVVGDTCLRLQRTEKLYASNP